MLESLEKTSSYAPPSNVPVLVRSVGRQLRHYYDPLPGRADDSEYPGRARHRGIHSPQRADVESDAGLFEQPGAGVYRDLLRVFAG